MTDATFLEDSIIARPTDRHSVLGRLSRWLTGGNEDTFALPRISAPIQEPETSDEAIEPRIDAFVVGQNCAMTGMGEAASRTVLRLTMGNPDEASIEALILGRESPFETSGPISVVVRPSPPIDRDSQRTINTFSRHEGWEILIFGSLMLIEVLPEHVGTYPDQSALADHIGRKADEGSATHMLVCRMARHADPDFHALLVQTRKTRKGV